MARSSGISHIIRGEDGLATAVWGVFTLKSAFQPLFSLARGKAEIAAYEGLIRPFARVSGRGKQDRSIITAGHYNSKPRPSAAGGLHRTRRRDCRPG